MISSSHSSGCAPHCTKLVVIAKVKGGGGNFRKAGVATGYRERGRRLTQAQALAAALAAAQGVDAGLAHHHLQIPGDHRRRALADDGQGLVFLPGVDPAQASQFLVQLLRAQGI